MGRSSSTDTPPVDRPQASIWASTSRPASSSPTPAEQQGVAAEAAQVPRDVEGRTAEDAPTIREVVEEDFAERDRTGAPVGRHGSTRRRRGTASSVHGGLLIWRRGKILSMVRVSFVMHTPCRRPILSDVTHLLACDLDGTVIPLEDGEEHRTQVGAFRGPWWKARGASVGVRHGQAFPPRAPGIEEHGFPHPTTSPVRWARACRSGPAGYQIDEGYRSEMAEALGIGMAEVRATLLEHPALWNCSGRGAGGVQGELHDRVAAAGGGPGRAPRELGPLGAHANLVVSQDRETGQGLVDALPAGVAKDRAVLHLAAREGLGRTAWSTPGIPATTGRRCSPGCCGGGWQRTGLPGGGVAA